MFLVVHASVGALIGEQTNNPSVAFSLGFLSHLIVDAVPHGDEVLGREFLKPGRKKWFIAIALIDGMVAFSFLTLLWLAGGLHNPVAAFSGALGAVMPDALQALTEATGGKVLQRFKDFHDWWHQLLGTEVSLAVGAVIQLVTFVVLWLFLAR